MSVCDEDNGVHSNGWTCGHCPMSARGPPHFHKHVNASKALAHLLKLKGQSVSACKGKGNIPNVKKVQYKALYNAGQLKSKLSKRRKEELDYDIAESQAKTVATPAKKMMIRMRPFD